MNQENVFYNIDITLSICILIQHICPTTQDAHIEKKHDIIPQQPLFVNVLNNSNYKYDNWYHFYLFWCNECPNKGVEKWHDFRLSWCMNDCDKNEATLMIIKIQI